jgi:carboxypeptidase T
MSNRRNPGIKLLVPLFLAVLPLLTIGSGAATTARAVAPTNPSTQALPPDNIFSILAAKPEVLVMQVYFRDRAERDRLAAEFSAEEVPTTSGFITIIGDNDTLNSLRTRGFRVEIDQHNTDILNDPAKRDTFYGGYKTVEEIYTFLDQKVAAHPTLAQKVDIGDSWCKTHPGSCTYPQPNNGYDLFVLHITNQAIPGPKPVFWFDAGIHSREIATPEVAMRYIDFLLESYNTNADAHWLVDYHDIWVMPSFNPDGHHIVEAPGEGEPYMYRKNGNRTLGNCSVPPDAFNHFGVDNNRNFPFLWNCCGGSVAEPCAQTYHGVSANSEEETQAVTAKIRTLIPDQRGPGNTDAAPITTTGVYQNLHTVVPVNLYPWGWTEDPAPNAADLSNIGAHMGAINAGGNGYESCTIPACLYIVDGGSIDWAYGELGAAAVSTELSGSGFLPAYSEIQGIYDENKGMLTYLAKIARTPYLTTRGPDANSVAAVPMTVTVDSSVTITGTINYAWTGNQYVQNVAAAEYYLDAPPWVSLPFAPMSASDGAYDEPTEAVQATLGPGSLSLGRHIIYVRGRGVNSYQGFPSWGPVSATFVDVVEQGSITPSPTATSTPVPPTSTPTGTATSAPTQTAIATATSTACTISFTDVDPENTFYQNIRCLACRGIISGYADGTFRPFNDITRGQIAKIVSNAAGYDEDPGPQIYEDVPIGSPFYAWINRLSMHGHMGGYPCDLLPQEPCVAPDNRPYFRPGNSATRGQISKIVSNAAGYDDDIPPTQQTFSDVPPGSTFWLYIERLVLHGVIGGYPCGGSGEPCDDQDRPYFRPNNNVTRGQAARIVTNTFFPNCQIPATR